MEILSESLLAFGAYFGSAIILTLLFVLIYVRTTPHNEIKLMREGNAAAALGLIGAVIGFVIPLSTVIKVSGQLPEAVLWGAIALVVQIIGSFVARMIFPTLTADVVAGKYSAAIVLAGMAVSLGVLQAACWTP